VNLNVSFEGIEGEGLALALDLRGLAIHSGPACATGSLKIPPVLAAIGLDAPRARASVTFSPGSENTPQEIDRAIELTASTVARLRALG